MIQTLFGGSVDFFEKKLYIRFMKKRWYDIDPALSVAIMEFEKAEDYIQLRCADFIIDKLKDFDFKVEMSLDYQYNYIMRRWYDKNIKVSHAMEYLKNSPEEVRRQLALEILEFIKEYENFQVSDEPDELYSV